MSSGEAAITKGESAHPLGSCSLGVSITLATILIVSSWLKIIDLGVWGSSGAVAAAQLAFAGWLLSGLQSRLALVAACVLFCVFAVASLASAAWGEECGCFGAVRVDSRAVVALDISAALAALGMSRVQWMRFGRLLVLPLIASILVVSASAVGLSAQRQSADTNYLGSIATEADVSRGQWDVLLLSSACDDCRDFFSDYLIRPRRSENVLLVFVSEPNAARELDYTGKLQGVRVGRWKSDAPPPVPTLLRAMDGQVMSDDNKHNDS
jgi:hypothetical protein